MKANKNIHIAYLREGHNPAPEAVLKLVPHLSAYHRHKTRGIIGYIEPQLRIAKRKLKKITTRGLKVAQTHFKFPIR